MGPRISLGGGALIVGGTTIYREGARYTSSATTVSSMGTSRSSARNGTPGGMRIANDGGGSCLRNGGGDWDRSRLRLERE